VIIIKQKTFVQSAGFIFSVVAAMHALRVVNGWDVVLGPLNIPMSASYVGVVVAGYLAYSAFTAKK
jgi:hypothetical protein